MRFVALFVTFAVLVGGCFPHNARARRIAKFSEGAAILAGIGMLAVINSGADCEHDPIMPNEPCKDKAEILGDIGLGLILAGLIGFIATVSTSPDDQGSTPAQSAPAPAPAAPAPPADPAQPAPAPAAN
ncbi:MAG: hypothetical protein AB7O24_31615 [Kofleriaceae bacterium]